MEGSKEYYLKLREQEFDELFGDMDWEQPFTYAQGNLIERLLASSIIQEQQEREYHSRLYRGDFSILEAEQTIEYLLNNQLDPVASGMNYNATDIKYKLKKEIG